MGYIQDKLESYRRKQALKKITHDLGWISESENAIYCYVDEKKFKSKCDYGNFYGFNLNHKPIIIQKTIYELNKDIIYIFDGISFFKTLTFSISSLNGTHSHIKFQNCTFTSGISIGKAENVEFMNNRSTTSIRSFYTKKGVENLKFVNDYTLSGFADITRIDINCDTLEMYNTEFHSDEPSIKAKNLIMNNSHICSGETIELDADTIELTNSDIYSSVAITLNAKDCNDFSSIKAYDITYNGLSLTKHNNSYEEIDKLVAVRQSLVDTLATIKVNEENYQKEEVSRYRKELKNLPLTRRLTKKNT